MAVIAYVAFQLALQSVYGEITFLYAGNFFPALVMLTDESASMAPIGSAPDPPRWR